MPQSAGVSAALAALFSLEGKRALVTGGAQGLGRMIAEGLVGAGAHVTITSRKQAACEAAVAELGEGGRCAAIVSDLNSAEAAVTLAKRVRADNDRLDILVNNAGRTWGAPIESFPDNAWSSVMSVNVQAPFTLVRELLPLMEKNATKEDPARVINIGSVAGAKVEPLRAYSYTASKAAIHMLSRQLASDLASRNIAVNALLPGFFPTKMTAHLQHDGEVDPAMLAHIPLGRLGQPQNIAGAVIFLCSPAGAYVTGVELPVDGGLLGCA